MSPLNEIALKEFGIEYQNLGKSEQEWCRDERQIQLDKAKYKR